MSDRIEIDPERSALLLIDIQPDFLPGGSLPVEEGDAIIEPLHDLMERDPFGLYVATQDWHPADHVSFASNHEGAEPMDTIELYGHEQVLWPDHCVQGTEGARLHPELPWERVSAIVRKGAQSESDSYSGFRNNWNPAGERPPTGLAGYLRERGVERVFLCGLARDVCVKWSAEDAADEGFDPVVLWDLTRSVDPGSDAGVRADLEEKGVTIVASEELG
ncbi:MAG: nicotinamidase [Gemmatimonadota bacterium]|nr:nicotinamidase [Gemmatimonadota bacterium]